MAANEYILIKENSSNLHDEKRVVAESGKVLGFDESLNPVMVSPSGTSAATGSDLNTGTDNVKMATALALTNSTYRRIHIGATAPTSGEEIWIDTGEMIEGSMLQVTGLSLDLSSWTQESGSNLYQYVLYNTNITEDTVVEIIPDNDDYLIVQSAMILPQVISGDGYVTIYSVNAPTDSIGVTLNIVITEFKEMNLTSNINYGMLYNYYAASDADIAPTGWHVATVSEVTALIGYCTSNGYSGTEGTALKSTVKWAAGAGDDAFDWYGLPVGIRYNDGSFGVLGTMGHFWCSDDEGTYGYYYRITFNEVDVTQFYTYKVTGMGIRCVRDSATGWTEGDTVTDYDGNVYETVQIGTQIWMKQPLAVTHLNDGTPITNITVDGTWAGASSAAYCSYGNDDSIAINE